MVLPPPFFFLLRIFMVIWGPLCFCIDFKILKIHVNNCLEILVIFFLVIGTEHRFLGLIGNHFTFYMYHQPTLCFFMGPSDYFS